MLPQSAFTVSLNCMVGVVQPTTKPTTPTQRTTPSSHVKTNTKVPGFQDSVHFSHPCDHINLFILAGLGFSGVRCFVTACHD